jgi:dihydrofolate synthase/folylpolyglutamate synthase
MFHRVGAAAYKADLSTTQELGKRLGNPELSYRTIHIAGTNGKDPLAFLVPSSRRRVTDGLFTSPHLKDFGSGSGSTGK